MSRPPALKRYLLIFGLVSVVNVLFVRYNPSDGCGFLPESYRNPRSEGYLLFRSTGEVLESANVNGQLVDIWSCTTGGGYVVLGAPPYFISGVLYPLNLLYNVLWIAAVSMVIAIIWERVGNRRGRAPHREG